MGSERTALWGGWQPARHPAGPWRQLGKLHGGCRPQQMGRLPIGREWKLLPELSRVWLAKTQKLEGGYRV
jgi:hypothetical protein